jgi:hypothetical protein
MPISEMPNMAHWIILISTRLSRMILINTSQMKPVHTTGCRLEVSNIMSPLMGPKGLLTKESNLIESQMTKEEEKGQRCIKMLTDLFQGQE